MLYIETYVILYINYTSIKIYQKKKEKIEINREYENESYLFCDKVNKIDVYRQAN